MGKFSDIDFWKIVRNSFILIIVSTSYIKKYHHIEIGKTGFFREPWKISENFPISDFCILNKKSYLLDIIQLF